MSNKLTLLPEYIDIIQQNSVEFYKSATNLMDVFNNYIGQLYINIEFEKSKVSPDIIKSTAELYNILNEKDFNIFFDDTAYKFDNIFKLFYIEKFQTLTEDIKQLITLNITSNNVYFNNYSDDTGNITDIKSVVDNSTSPFYDIFDDIFNLPTSVPGSIYYKISKNELQTSLKLNSKTDALLKLHIAGIHNLNNINIATTAHGENLVTDNLYIDRLYKFRNIINSKLKDILGNMADFISFFKHINYRDQDNCRTAGIVNFETEIEGLNARIDVLKNKLNVAQKVTF